MKDICIEVLPPQKGLWDFRLFRGNSRDPSDLVDHFVRENLIVTTGKQHVMDRLFGLSSSAALAGVSVGTNSTAAAIGDTSITSTGITTPYKAFTTATRSALVVTTTTDYSTAEGNGTLTEAGIITAQGGILYNRLVFASLPKSSALSLQITITITQA
jgi:hypothetical protein